VGQLVLLGVPGEFSTMAGRRLRATVKAVFDAAGITDTIVIVSGLSNTYTGYITTEEEYGNQRYEGASTVFGPHTLAAYQQLFTELATALVKGTTLPAGPTPRNLSHYVPTFIPPVIVDTAPSFDHFGKIYADVNATYAVGGTVEVVFYGANPRNNLLTGRTFLEVEKLDTATNTYSVILTDSDWDTKFLWKRHETSQSLITISWTIGTGTPAGKYRIQHYGFAKEDPISGKVTPYNGLSSVFTVL